VTTVSVIAALLGVSVLCPHLGRGAVPLVLAYLALRRSEPAERTEILTALAPALSAASSLDHPDVRRDIAEGA
jgi:hypothetical protein